MCITLLGLTRTKHHEASIGPINISLFESSHYCCQGNSTGTLHIVVEAGDLWRVLLQDTPGVVQAKVLEVDVCLWISLSARSNKLVDEFVVLFAPNPLFSHTQVQVVVEKVFILLRVRCCYLMRSWSLTFVPQSRTTGSVRAG